MHVETHIRLIANWITSKIRAKYKAGQAEHGGLLWRKPTLPCMIEEVTDLVVYLEVHERHVALALGNLRAALNGTNSFPEGEIKDLVRCAYNLLQYGNEEGIEEVDVSER